MKTLKPSILLISIDALRPCLVLEQEKYNVKLPNLYKLFVENGMYASGGLKSIFPTFTYPCHQSIITGTNPITHGIYTNNVFDPMDEYKGAWNWFVSEDVPTLWEIAKNNGYLTASVAFPTSVNAPCDYLIPEYWYSDSTFDRQIINALSYPRNLLNELNKALACYPHGLEMDVDGDKKRFNATLWLLNSKIKDKLTDMPLFLTTYFASYDEMAHVHGVFSKQALDALEEIDYMVGYLVQTFHQSTNNNIITCVVSDHGALDNKFTINPNSLLYKAGLIKTNSEGKIVEWQAWCQRSGGTAQIILKNPNELTVKAKVENILENMLKDANSGILQILSKDECVNVRKGYPLADYALIAKKGYEIRENYLCDYLSDKTTLKGQHGYSEDFYEMRASFFIEGINIPKGIDILNGNIIDIAPTIAAFLGWDMPTCEGKNMVVRQ